MYKEWGLGAKALHSHQHANQADRSIETAFQGFIYETEMPLKDGLLMLESFMDIKRAMKISPTSPCARQVKSMVWNNM